MSQFVKSFVGFGDTGSALLFMPASGLDYFYADNADSRMTLLIRNSNTQAATVTLKAGDGTLSPLGDVTVTVAGGQIYALPLCRAESARVKVLSGSGAGNVYVNTAVAAGGVVGAVSAALVSVE